VGISAAAITAGEGEMVMVINARPEQHHSRVNPGFRAEWADFYISTLGFAITKIPPGMKKPVHEKWNSQPWDEGEKTGYFIESSPAVRHYTLHPYDNMGVVHAPSQTAALDVDDKEKSRLALGDSPE
jgi:hypothetical protein